MLAKIRAGDATAFEDLVRGLWDELVDHIAWVAGSYEVAEDCSQEAFIRLWEQREQWYEGSARALVFRIARNLAFDARRRAKVRADWATRQSWSVDSQERPDDVAETSEYEERLRRALAELTPARREVIELVRLRGFTHQEAADALEISKQTVANRMTLALADLRTLLADLLPELRARQLETHGREATDG